MNINVGDIILDHVDQEPQIENFSQPSEDSHIKRNVENVSNLINVVREFTEAMGEEEFWDEFDPGDQKRAIEAEKLAQHISSSDEKRNSMITEVLPPKHIVQRNKRYISGTDVESDSEEPPKKIAPPPWNLKASNSLPKILAHERCSNAEGNERRNAEKREAVKNSSPCSELSTPPANIQRPKSSEQNTSIFISSKSPWEENLISSSKNSYERKSSKSTSPAEASTPPASIQRPRRSEQNTSISISNKSLWEESLISSFKNSYERKSSKSTSPVHSNNEVLKEVLQGSLSESSLPFKDRKEKKMKARSRSHHKKKHTKKERDTIDHGEGLRNR